jgi:hypothetical protein
LLSAFVLAAVFVALFEVVFETEFEIALAALDTVFETALAAFERVFATEFITEFDLFEFAFALFVELVGAPPHANAKTANDRRAIKSKSLFFIN